MIKTLTFKFPNMKKVACWVLYPQRSDTLDEVIIQCDRRIARVSLSTGKALLSDGKGGHQGFMKLSPSLGAKLVTVPDDAISQLRDLCASNVEGDGIGSVRLT